MHHFNAPKKLRFFSLAVGATTALAVAWPTARAQNAQPPTQPHDARATVPKLVYRSAFLATSLGVENDTVDWRKANDDVGKYTRGHVDILKAEEQADAKKEAAKAATPTPNSAKPVAAPAHKH